MLPKGHCTMFFFQLSETWYTCQGLTQIISKMHPKFKLAAFTVTSTSHRVDLPYLTVKSKVIYAFQDPFLLVQCCLGRQRFSLKRLLTEQQLFSKHYVEDVGKFLHHHHLAVHSKAIHHKDCYMMPCMHSLEEKHIWVYSVASRHDLLFSIYSVFLECENLRHQQGEKKAGRYVLLSVVKCIQ